MPAPNQNQFPTLSDHAKRMDPGGKIDKIAELLTQTNEILHDMVLKESNQPTSHVSTIRTGLPEAAWRKLYQGVPQSKSKTQQVTDTIGMLEAYAEVDKALADLNGNTAEFRLSEDRAFLEAMNQTMARTLFYGNTDINPERFLGLGPRYSALSGAGNSGNIISAGGSGNALTSIWLVAWGADTVFGIYPKGQKAGLLHEDKGQVTLDDEVGNHYEGYRTHYSWKLGLVVRDWRYIVRIANIPTAADDLADVNLIALMTQASEMLPEQNLGKPVFYMNRPLRTALRTKITDKNNVNLTLENYAGKKALAFDGIAVRRVDAILNTESALS
jgi:hypothetical protein